MKKDDFKIVNPPWVYGPSEVKEWIDATYPSKKSKRGKREERKEEKHLQNPRFLIDIKVDKKVLTHPLIRFFLKPFGLEKVEEEFDCMDLAQKFLRGFAKAGFKNVFEVKTNKEVIYRHPEKGHDAKQVVDFLSSFLDKGYVKIDLKVVFENYKATVFINRIHARKDCAVKVFFNGRIDVERVSRFLNYVNEHLDAEIRTL